MDIFDRAEQETGRGQDVFDQAASEMTSSDGDIFDAAEQESRQPSFYKDVVKKTGQDIWEGVKATPETALAMLSGTANFATTVPASGLAGLYKYATTGDIDKAGETIEDIQSKFAYIPKNKKARQSAEAVGKVFTVPGQVAGNLTLKATGHPGLASGVATLGELGMILGLPRVGSKLTTPKGLPPKAPTLPEGFKPDPKVFRRMDREKVGSNIAEMKKGPERPLAKLKEAENRLAGKEPLPVEAPAPKPKMPASEFLKNERSSVEAKGVGAKQAIKDKTISLREYVEDDWIRVKKLTQRPDVKISDATDPYAAETRYRGRLQARLENAEKTVESIDKHLLSASKKSKIPDDQMIRDVNEYMIAKHAPERNLEYGDKAAGITTEGAFKKIEEIKSKPYFEDVKVVSDRMFELNHQTLDILLDAEVITEALHTKLRKKYENHVPLNRVMDETGDIVEVLKGKGLDVKGTGLKRAKGSEREVADIMTNIVANHKAALARAEKNIVDLHTARFVRENNYFDGLFEEIKPQVIGTDFKGNPIYSEIKDPQTLSFRENGKQRHFKINDPHLATALKGVNRQQLHGVLNWVKSFTRFYSGLMTRYNFEFALSNKLRDLQEAAVYGSSKKEIGGAGAVKTIGKDPASMKAITDYIRGKQTPGAKLYEQMRMDGGTTGGLSLSTRQQIELDISAIRKANRSTPRKAAKSVVRAVDKWNTLFEDSTRLSVYKQALENGATRQRAAVLAKEASVNFDKMGTGGPLINGMYMFSNASIQGSAKMLRALKDPKTAALVATTVGTAVYTANSFNDKADPEWRQKVSEWDRLNGLNIVVSQPGEDFDYITIPSSWGLKPIKVMMEKAYDVYTGHGDDPAKIASDIATSIIEGYNPIGGTDIISGLTPTILDTPMDLARNKKWSGQQIKPDYDPFAPESIKYYDSLKDKAAGDFLISATRKAAKKGIEISPADIHYAYQQYIGGAGRFVDKTMTTAKGIATGEGAPSRDVPFLSRVYRSTPKDEVRKRPEDLDDLKGRLTEQSRDRFYEKQEQKELLEKLKGMPRNEAANKFEQLAADNPPLAKDLLGLIEKDDLEYKDHLVKKLGVENWQRSQYLAEQLQQLSDKQRHQKWEEWSDKGILSNKVKQQTIYLLKNNQ